MFVRRRLGRLFLVVVTISAAAWIGCSNQGDDGESASGANSTSLLRVAAASGLKFAFDEIASEFEAESGDIQLETTFGSSGNFYTQLSQQAPFDLYLSADIEYPRKLIHVGLAEEKSLFVYGFGQIVIWVTNDSPIDVESQGMKALLDPKVEKVAIANPRHAPYGRAAEAAMKSLGVYGEVEPKLVLGENIAQTAQFVESGAADIGILALSLAVAPTLKEKGRYWFIPVDAYPKIEQGGVILSGGNASAAERLRRFLLGEKGRAILQRYGFLMPGE